MAFLYFGGDTHTALAAPQKPTEGFWRVYGLVRVATLDNDLLHLVEKTLLDDGSVSSLVHFTAVFEQAAIKSIRENELHAVFVERQAAETSHAILEKKGRNIFEPGIAFGVQLKGGANDFRLLAVNDNCLCPHVIEIADRRRRGKLPALHFGSQSALYVATQIANKLIRHAELDRHHENVIGRVVASVVRADMLNDVFLQKPTYLSAVHGIACQAVKLPTHDTGRFAFLHALQHFAEHRTTGHLSAALLHEFANNL